MRPIVRSLQVLGLALLVALGAGAVVSADSSSLRQAAYPTGPSGTTGPTGTATVTPTRTPTATPTRTPVASPRIRLTLVKKSATRRRGVKAKVSFNRQGRVTLKAAKGKKKLSARAVNFKAPGRKTVRLSLKKLKRGQLPAQVTVRAQGRDTSGARSKLVRKTVKIRR